MREIKFRGRRSWDKKWIEGNLIINKNGGKSIIPFEQIEEDGHHLVFNTEDDVMFFDQETIGEFTGLKDMNGVKIYEGDIIEGEGVKGILFWDEILAKFSIKLGDRPRGGEIIGASLIKEAFILGKARVIGNIHEEVK